MDRPIVGITPDVIDRQGVATCRVATTYAARVERAGGLPVVLTPSMGLVGAYAGWLDAAVFTGGDDPIMEDFGVPTHARAVRVHPARQAFELALIRALRERGTPSLGVCLGMQYMGLTAGGSLDQHLPETTPTAAAHWEAIHAIQPEPGWTFGGGEVHSKHRQAISDPGSLAVLARADDGVIEAIGDPKARFWIGVQWHPERTRNAALGQDLFDALVRAAKATT
ncbi:MAG: gamma-glutamyl-gamma-aminobutyrate hydrolase family protein [Phycisphaeraceae bacterium]|nr:MAG: gamma-glutamyl-gamma-aminobutyrate hydrolase family protein [Phycisphaeraceae bacterium]